MRGGGGPTVPVRSPTSCGLRCCGALRRGLLPGEANLAAEFTASRNAVRDAPSILVAKVSSPASRAPAPSSPRASTRTACTTSGRPGRDPAGSRPVNEVRAAGIVTPPPAVAARLRVPGNGRRSGRVVYLERLRHLNGLPLSLDLTYLAADVGGPLLGGDLARHDIFALIEALRPGPGRRRASPSRPSTPTRTPPRCWRPHPALRCSWSSG